MRQYIRLTILVFCLMAFATLVTKAMGHQDVKLIRTDTETGTHVEVEILYPKTKTGIDYAQIAEDMEIMSRVIGKTLEQEFPKDFKMRLVIHSESSYERTKIRGCQGIYLKGYGAVFMISARFPLAEQKPPEPEAKAAPDDLWQETKNELRGMPNRRIIDAGGRKYESRYESEIVERLKRELLKLIGTYAPNIRQLGSQENVVIAVRGTSGFPVVAEQPALTISQLRKLTSEQLALTYSQRRKLESEHPEVEHWSYGQRSNGKSLKPVTYWGHSHRIPYKLEEPGEVTIKIYDVKGQLVRTYDLGQKDIGADTAHWDGKNDAGEEVASGVYLYKTNAGDSSTTGKLVVVGGTFPKTLTRGIASESLLTHLKDDKVLKVQELGLLQQEKLHAKIQHQWSYVPTSARIATGRTMLIVKVNKESIMAYKDGQLDLDGLLKQAEITQY